MINRRKFIQSGTCAICCGAGSAIAEPDYQGCMLAGTEIAERIDPHQPLDMMQTDPVTLGAQIAENATRAIRTKVTRDVLPE